MRSYSKWYAISSEVIIIQGKVGWLWTCIQNKVHFTFRKSYVSSKNCLLLSKNLNRPYFFLYYPLAPNCPVLARPPKSILWKYCGVPPLLLKEEKIWSTNIILLTMLWLTNWPTVMSIWNFFPSTKLTEFATFSIMYYGIAANLSSHHNISVWHAHILRLLLEFLFPHKPFKQYVFCFLQYILKINLNSKYYWDTKNTWEYIWNDYITKCSWLYFHFNAQNV